MTDQSKLIKTGDILLVSGTDEQAKIIQEFQCKEDAVAGIYNHSGIFYWSAGKNLYIIEASYVQQRKIKAAIVITPFDKYINKDCSLLRLSFKDDYSTNAIEKTAFNYVGTPYEYMNLLVEQPLRILFNIWLGRKKKADKKFICHEFSQTVWNVVEGIFPECYKGDVSKLYWSKYFEHIEIK